MLANKYCHCPSEALSEFQSLSYKNKKVIVNRSLSVQWFIWHTNSCTISEQIHCRPIVPGGRPGSDARWIRGGRMKRPSPAERRGLGARLRTTSTGVAWRRRSGVTASLTRCNEQAWLFVNWYTSKSKSWTVNNACSGCWTFMECYLRSILYHLGCSCRGCWPCLHILTITWRYKHLKRKRND